MAIGVRGIDGHRGKLCLSDRIINVTVNGLSDNGIIGVKSG